MTTTMTGVYQLTDARTGAIFSNDGQFGAPRKYRPLLGLIGAAGHIDVLRGRLRHFPDRLIDDWLKELVDQKMIEASPAGKLEDFTFTGRKAPRLPARPDEDSKSLAKTAVVAGATLLRSGSFIANDRVANLPPLGKPP